MRILRRQIVGLLVLFYGTLPLHGMFTPSSRLSRAMRQKRQQLQSTQYQFGQQKMGYSGTTPDQPGFSFLGWVKSFFESKQPEPLVQQQFLPRSIEQKSFSTAVVPIQQQFFRQEEPLSHLAQEGFSEQQAPFEPLAQQQFLPRSIEQKTFSTAVPIQQQFFRQEESLSHLAQEGFSEQQAPFVQKEEDIARRDEMFAFIRSELDQAKKYFILLRGNYLSRIINKLYEYEDVLNQEKDGHTILGEIISVYGFHFKAEMDQTKLFESIHSHRAETVLKFFREVKKLGANSMTSDDFREIEKIKNGFISFLTTRYSGAEELIPFKDILAMADVFEELKGEGPSFWFRANKIYPWIFSFSSFIDIEFGYRSRKLSVFNENANVKIYNDLVQLLKEAVASIFGEKSEFYQKFINRLQQVQSYTDDEISEIEKMRDKIESELVDVKQKKLWQEWQKLREQKQAEKEKQSVEKEKYEKLQQELAYANEQKKKATFKKGQGERDRQEQIKREQQLEWAKKEEERKKKEEEQKRQHEQEQQKRYQQEQQQREQQRRDQQQEEFRKSEEEREKREQSEQEERERLSSEELKLLMALARGEYIKSLKENTPKNEPVPNIFRESSDKELEIVYKKLIQKLHPDKMGDKAKAQLLNAVRTEYINIKKALNKSNSSQSSWE